MNITYQNPLGQTKTANLSAEQIEVLKTKEGFKVVEDNEFNFDLPVVESK